MCVIIHKPKGVVVPLSTILRGYQNNSDGWGIAARTPEGIIVQRDYGAYADETLLDAYDSLREHELVLHCRIGTSGVRDVRNTHPFNVGSDDEPVWLFHNGVLSEVSRKTNLDLCDTFHFGEQFVAPEIARHGVAVLADPNFVAYLAEASHGSRLVLVSDLGVTLVNAETGYVQDGSWFSNDTAHPRKPSAYASRGSLARPFDVAAEDDDDEMASRYDDAYYDAWDDWDGYTFAPPRAERVRCKADELRLYQEATEFLTVAQDMDVDDLTDLCRERPEIAAEAFTLQNGRFFTRTAALLTSVKG